MNAAQQRAATDAAMDFALSSDDPECLESVHSLALAKRIITRMVNYGKPMSFIVACANHEEWGNELFETIRNTITLHSRRWHELVEAVVALEENSEPVNFSGILCGDLFSDPRALALIAKKFRGSARAAGLNEHFWASIVRALIAKRDLTRAFDELKKLVRYPEGQWGRGDHLVEVITFRELVDELYAALAIQDFVPLEPGPEAFDRYSWPEYPQWTVKMPDALVYLGSESKAISPAFGKWYLMRRWRADQKRRRR